MELVIDNLACNRGGRQVFRDLSLRLSPGTPALVRGPNGVGKSSLLRVLAGLTPLASGDARLGDLSLASDRAAFQASDLGPRVLGPLVTAPGWLVRRGSKLEKI